MALGGHTPFYRLWYLLPMMKVVRAPAMIFYIAQLAIAVFGAIGLERVLREGVRRRYLIGWGVFAVVIVILAGGGALTSIAQSLAAPERYAFVEQNTGALIGGAVRSLLFVALALGVLWAGAQRPLSGVAMAAALVALAAADLWSVERRYFQFSPPARQLYASDPTIEYLHGSRSREGDGVGVDQRWGYDPVRTEMLSSGHRVRASRVTRQRVATRVELAAQSRRHHRPNLFKREFGVSRPMSDSAHQVDLPPEHPKLPGMRLFAGRASDQRVGEPGVLYEPTNQTRRHGSRR